jgi:hypothetical protein
MMKRWLTGLGVLLLESSGNAAVPPDVRKAFGLPVGAALASGLRPGVGAEPRIFIEPDGSAERFRTSDGLAEPVQRSD